MKPYGFNDAHSVTLRAFRDFIDSQFFEGVFTPGVFYDFCSNHSMYAEINKDFRYNWGIDLHNICNQFGIPYRAHRPPSNSKRSARRTASELISNARHWQQDCEPSLVAFLAQRFGKTKSVINASLQRSVGCENVLYLLGCCFELGSLPDLTRDDLKIFSHMFVNTISTRLKNLYHMYEHLSLIARPLIFAMNVVLSKNRVG